MFENFQIWQLVLLGLGAAAGLYAMYKVLAKDSLLSFKLKQSANDEYIADPVGFYIKSFNKKRIRMWR